jgi:hypothetical protein
MGSPFSTQFTAQLEKDILVVDGYAALDGYSDVRGTLPTQSMPVNQSYTRLYGAQNAIGPVLATAPQLFLQPHVSTGIYTFTLDEPWLALLGVTVTQGAPSSLISTTPAPSPSSSFAVLGGSGVTNTGTTVLNGNLGSYPTVSETGFPPGIVNGVDHAGDAVTQAAKIDLTARYVAAAALPGAITIPTDLNGQILAPGVYSSLSGTFSNSGTLTLDGYGGSGTWTFQMSTTLVTSASSTVVLIGGAQASSVTWQVGSSATLGATSTLQGNVLALTSISTGNGAVVNGSLLARNGAVTLIGSTVTVAAAAQNTKLLFYKVNANVTGLATGSPGGDNNNLVGGNLPGTDPSQTLQTVTIFFLADGTGALTDPDPNTGFWVHLVLKRAGAVSGD